MKELFDKKLRDKSFEEGLKNAVKRINPCQAHAFSDEGAESLGELDIKLPLKCVYYKDYNLCSCKNVCEQCKID